MTPQEGGGGAKAAWGSKGTLARVHLHFFHVEVNTATFNASVLAFVICMAEGSGAKDILAIYCIPPVVLPRLILYGKLYLGV